MIKYLSLAGLLATVSWFFWNPNDWKFDWEPIVVFIGLLALYIKQERNSSNKSLIVNEVKTSHPADIDLYKKLMVLLPSNGVIQFLANHDFLSSFGREDINPLDEFRFSWNNAEHKFIDSEIEKLRNDLHMKTELFQRAIGEYTSPNDSGRQAVKLDRPPITDEKDWKYWSDKNRNEGNIINKKADELISAHQLFVKKAREKLI